MRILQFRHLGSTAINYYRHWQFGRALQSRGHTVGMRTEPALEPFGYASTVQEHDPVWLLKYGSDYDELWSTLPYEPQQLATLLGLREALTLIHGQYAPLFIDIDDLVTDIPNYNAAGEQIRRNSDRTKVAVLALKAADFVTTTCEFLAERVRPHNPHVIVLPNCVEPAMWNHPRPTKHDDRVRVLWSGSSARFGDIVMLRDTLFWLHDTYGDRVKLIFTATCPDFAVPWVEQGFAFVTRWAPLPDYMAVMRYIAPDIGLAPLLSNDFNRSKSPLKYLDHAMIECAGVYSDECTYDCVQDGTTGLIARTPAEWQQALTQLIEQPELRHRIASASRADVLQRFNIETQSSTIERLLTQAISDARERHRSADDRLRRPGASPIRGPQRPSRADSRAAAGL